jgi:hypothetical protein
MASIMPRSRLHLSFATDNLRPQFQAHPRLTRSLLAPATRNAGLSNCAIARPGMPRPTGGRIKKPRKSGSGYKQTLCCFAALPCHLQSFSDETSLLSSITAPWTAAVNHSPQPCALRRSGLLRAPTRGRPSLTNAQRSAHLLRLGNAHDKGMRDPPPRPRDVD